MEESEYIQRSYHLCQRHLKLFDNVNANNHSQALRTILDSIINGEEQLQKKQVIDNSILYISLGFVLFSFTFTTNNPFVYLIGLSLGLFLITYGGIGGLQLAIRRTKHHR